MAPSDRRCHLALTTAHLIIHLAAQTSALLFDFLYMTTQNILAQQYYRQLCVSITTSFCTEETNTACAEFLMHHFQSLEYVTRKSGVCDISSVTVETKPASLYKFRWLICFCLHESLPQITVEVFELEKTQGWRKRTMDVGLCVCETRSWS